MPAEGSSQRAEPSMTWSALVAQTPKKCEICSGALKPCRLSFDEALWQCQTPGCVFPLGAPNFDEFVVRLEKSQLFQATLDKAAKAVEERNARQGPQPFPIAGFATSAPDEDSNLDISSEIEDIPGESDSANATQQSENSVLSIEEFLFGNDGDTAEENENTDNPKLEHSSMPRHAPSPSATVMSQSSLDTLVSTPSQQEGVFLKRMSSEVSEGGGEVDMDSIWDSASEAEGTDAGDATPLFPRRSCKRVRVT